MEQDTTQQGRRGRRMKKPMSAKVMIRQALLAAALFVGAVGWTVSLDQPWAEKGMTSLKPVVVAPLSVEEEAERLARVLGEYTDDLGMARRVATALVNEGRRHGLEPTLLAGVLLEENWTLNPRARSWVGARGLMQVMPFHKGRWGCGSGSLYDVETNICTGVSIFADYLERAGTTERALLRYNGCVTGKNTPDCHKYPSKVLSRAEKTSRQLLASAGTSTLE